ncbi:unnamed protein product [Closterium sp. NIES-64]|nr:unnamed protein product [Closterium sp. NIES-64]
MTACRCWFLYRRKKEQKKDTRTTVVRIPGGASWFRTRANYAAFENRGMTQVMPILIADNMDGCKPAEVEQRTKEVRAFRKGEWGAWGVGLSGGGWHGWSGRGGGGGLGGLFTVLGGDSEVWRWCREHEAHSACGMASALSHGDGWVRAASSECRMMGAIGDAFPDQKSSWNFSKVHQIVHLIDAIPLRGMPWEYSTELWEHTHKGTVKVPVRGSNWKDIPRRIVEEEVQREITREVASLAGGGRQYVTALREVSRPHVIGTGGRLEVPGST